MSLLYYSEQYIKNGKSVREVVVVGAPLPTTGAPTLYNHENY